MKVLEFVRDNAKTEELGNQIINWGGEGSVGVGKGAIGSTASRVAPKFLTYPVISSITRSMLINSPLLFLVDAKYLVTSNI